MSGRAKTDFCSVTVWYNPDSSSVQNLLTYNSFCKKCYIVDNSSGDNSALAQKIPNAVYIPNGQNIGIAAALNAGCSRALAEGFSLCMTMDQDSSWVSDQLERYFGLCAQNLSETAVSFCPNARYLMPTSWLGDARRFLRSLFGLKKIAGGQDAEAFVLAAQSLGEQKAVDCCITSGNVISLAAWEKVGRFYEPFFIDEVDHEFCFRLGQSGFKITKFCGVFMAHVLGSPRKTFYPCVSHHGGVRLYYIFRNALFLKKMHPDYFKKLNYSLQIKSRVKSLVFNLRLFELRYYFMALRDFKRGKLGKFNG